MCRWPRLSELIQSYELGQREAEEELAVERKLDKPVTNKLLDNLLSSCSLVSAMTRCDFEVAVSVLKLFFLAVRPSCSSCSFCSVQAAERHR